jgi:hypothetical protein
MEKKIRFIPAMSIIGIIVKVLKTIKPRGQIGRNQRIKELSPIFPCITRVVLPIPIVHQKNHQYQYLQNLRVQWIRNCVVKI